MSEVAAGKGALQYAHGFLGGGKTRFAGLEESRDRLMGDTKLTTRLIPPKGPRQ